MELINVVTFLHPPVTQFPTQSFYMYKKESWWGNKIVSVKKMYKIIGQDSNFGRNLRPSKILSKRF